MRSSNFMQDRSIYCIDENKWSITEWSTHVETFIVYVPDWNKFSN